MEKDFVSVFSPKVARILIKKGFNVVDIKPFKENTERTIFIFNRTADVMKIIHESVTLRQEK